MDRMDSAAGPFEHLLAVLESAGNLLRDVGRDTDAAVLDAHRGQLARGHEWPGDEVQPVTFCDGSTNADELLSEDDAPIRLVPAASRKAWEPPQVYSREQAAADRRARKGGSR